MTETTPPAETFTPSEYAFSRLNTVRPKKIETKFVEIDGERKYHTFLTFECQLPLEKQPKEYTVTYPGGLGPIGNNCVLDIIETSISYPNDPTRGKDNSYFCLIRNPDKSIPPLPTSIIH